MKTEEEIRKELGGYDKTEREEIMEAMRSTDWAVRISKLSGAITLGAWRAALLWVLKDGDDD